MKLGLAGDRLGAILAVGVRNDVAKRVTDSIYRQVRRWYSI
jgi:aspartate/tyrosine/aromatic aminotransferase